MTPNSFKVIPDCRHSNVGSYYQAKTNQSIFSIKHLSGFHSILVLRRYDEARVDESVYQYHVSSGDTEIYLSAATNRGCLQKCSEARLMPVVYTFNAKNVGI